MVKVPVTIKKTFEKYSKESRVELTELSKRKILTTTGRLTERKIYVSIERPEVVEVRIYDLSNFGKNAYCDFNKKVKKLSR